MTGETGVQVSAESESLNDLFENYSGYNKVLRTWFVTFGLGGPSLFLINPDLQETLRDSGNMKFVVGMFLLGCALQISIGVINKNCAWYVYNVRRYPHHANSCWYRIWLWLERQYWLDLICDVGTVFLFALAVWKTFATFVA